MRAEGLPEMSAQMISSFTRVMLGVCAGAALFAMGSASAQAMPGSAIAAAPDASVILVEGHCGIGWWRGPEGHCRPDRERVVVEPVLPVPPVVVVEPERVCPFGMHWSHRRHECVLN
jgi:hypothetical protein